MKIYRTMCQEEAQKSIHNQMMVFIKRYKYFSPNLCWILSRVCDGKFNNSNHKTDRYTHVLEFSINSDHYFIKGKKEYKIDRRNIQLFKVINVRLIIKL